MKYQYTVKGVDYEVEIQDIEGNIANVTVNGIPCLLYTSPSPRD